MTIIYLINHSTNKLFNEVCIYIKIDPPQADLKSSIENLQSLDNPHPFQLRHAIF